MPDRRVRADVFPAHVVIRAAEDVQVFEKVRVVVTMDTLYIFKDSSTGPALAFTERLAAYDAGVPPHRRSRSNPARSASATTDSGASVEFTRGSSCGCGSRLKSFDPFGEITNMASTKDR